MAKIHDKRSAASQVSKPWGFVVFTDSFMSGWGEAEGGRSLYALAVDSPDQATTVLTNGGNRSEMKRGRIVSKLPRLGPNDHMSIVDRERADPWYVAGSFAPQGKRRRR